MFTRMIRRRLPPLTRPSTSCASPTHATFLRRYITPGSSLYGRQTFDPRQRAFSTTFTRQAPTHGHLESLADPTRPDLFYHLTSLPNSPNIPVYALSFLSTLPVTLAPDSPAVIGWLPASAEAEGEAGLNDFKENPKFRDALHKAVQASLENESDEILKNAAISTGEGWMHINDERNPPPLGRIGEPDDIIGSVRVEGGKIIRGTYSPMPAYRVVTADGVVTLTPGVAEHLLAHLSKVASPYTS